MCYNYYNQNGLVLVKAVYYRTAVVFVHKSVTGVCLLCHVIYIFCPKSYIGVRENVIILLT